MQTPRHIIQTLLLVDRKVVFTGKLKLSYSDEAGVVFPYYVSRWEIQIELQRLFMPSHEIVRRRLLGVNGISLPPIELK